MSFFGIILLTNYIVGPMLPTGTSLSRFSREQKTGFVFMLVFAVMTIGLGGLQLRNTVYGPFITKPSKTPSLSRLASADEARLKSIDTDHDGLSDWEELNQYTTSPYLADTDSDKISDKTEIDKGTDPLCPEGDKCATSADIGTTSTSSLASVLLNKTTDSLSILSGAVDNAANLSTVARTDQLTQSPENNIDIENIISDPVKLRALILKTGKIDSATLEKIDDKTLQKMAQNLFVSASSTTQTNIRPVASSTSTP